MGITRASDGRSSEEASDSAEPKTKANDDCDDTTRTGMKGHTKQNKGRGRGEGRGAHRERGGGEMAATDRRES